MSFIGAYVGGQSESDSKQNNVQVVFQSREDKPDLPEEKATSQREQLKARGA